MCGSKVKKNIQKAGQGEPPPPAPPVKETSPVVTQVKRNIQKAQARRKTQAGTVLAGETGGAETRQKTLLGGG